LLKYAAQPKRIAANDYRRGHPFSSR
jgi:hypothetical protein